MLIYQDVARDVVNSVRNDVLHVMTAVRELQMSQMTSKSHGVFSDKE